MCKAYLLPVAKNSEIRRKTGQLDVNSFSTGAVDVDMALQELGVREFLCHAYA